jgi:ABC-type antimicrobial peptide transport system permease subunit
VREIVRQADARVPVAAMRTQAELVDRTFNQEIVFARLCTAFAALALAIACVGLYGTMAYCVARRTSEIGIRIALGARRDRVVWMVMREALVLAAAGLAVSAPIVSFASKLIESYLFEMKGNDPIAMSGAVIVLVAAVVLAAWLPARAAARIDPMQALRQE